MKRERERERVEKRGYKEETYKKWPERKRNEKIITRIQKIPNIQWNLYPKNGRKNIAKLKQGNNWVRNQLQKWRINQINSTMWERER